MMMVAMIVVTLITSWVISGWKAVREREVRWAFYELRDQLRFAAIKDPMLGKVDAFWRLDRSLTRYCATLDDISLWMVVPLMGRLPDLENDAELEAFRRQVQSNVALLHVY